MEVERIVQGFENLDDLLEYIELFGLRRKRLFVSYLSEALNSLNCRLPSSDVCRTDLKNTVLNLKKADKNFPCGYESFPVPRHYSSCSDFTSNVAKLNYGSIAMILDSVRRTMPLNCEDAVIGLDLSSFYLEQAQAKMDSSYFIF